MTRDKKNLEKSNLSMYLKIVSADPSVTSTHQMRNSEAKRSEFVNIISNRVTNANRVKTLADALLRTKYGTSGSSRRLILHSRTNQFDEGCKTPSSLSQRNRSFDEDRGLTINAFPSPFVSHLIDFGTEKSAERVQVSSRSAKV